MWSGAGARRWCWARRRVLRCRTGVCTSETLWNAARSNARGEAESRDRGRRGLSRRAAVRSESLLLRSGSRAP